MGFQPSVHGQPLYGQQPPPSFQPYQPPYGELPYGQPPYGQPPYGQPSHGQQHMYLAHPGAYLPPGMHASHMMPPSLNEYSPPNQPPGWVPGQQAVPAQQPLPADKPAWCALSAPASTARNPPRPFAVRSAALHSPLPTRPPLPSASHLTRPGARRNRYRMLHQSVQHEQQHGLQHPPNAAPAQPPWQRMGDGVASTAEAAQAKKRRPKKKRAPPCRVFLILPCPEPIPPTRARAHAAEPPPNPNPPPPSHRT